MIRTNSKKARENIREYIRNKYDGESYNFPETTDFNTIAANILDVFHEEKPRNKGNEQEIFMEYCAGLPTILDTCYYYNRSAVDDLGEILEETDEEKAKYSEQDAEKLLTYLIYRELVKATRA